MTPPKHHHRFIITEYPDDGKWFELARIKERDNKIVDWEIADLSARSLATARKKLSRATEALTLPPWTEQELMEATGKHTQYHSNRATPPGHAIMEQLWVAGVSRNEFAQRCGVSPEYADGLIDGTEPLTTEIAEVLESLGIGTAQFWKRFEAGYREDLARLEITNRDIENSTDEDHIADVSKKVDHIPDAKKMTERQSVFFQFFDGLLDHWFQIGLFAIVCLAAFALGKCMAP